jgi:hypothetical protein
MATTVIRMACELTDGDEILSLCLPDDEGSVPVATVLEKTTDPDDNVLLLIRVAPALEVQTAARPRELTGGAAAGISVEEITR